MTLEQLLKAFNYRIEDGSEYCWKSYPNARYIDFHEEKYGAWGNLLHSTVDQIIYEATVHSDDHGPYRWRNTDFIDANNLEYKQHDIEDVAWDDTKWIDIEVEEDFLNKASAIFRGEEFDERIEIKVELEDELMYKLCLEAHKRDITFNQLVSAMIEEMIEREKLKKNEVKEDIEHSKYWYDTERNR